LGGKKFVVFGGRLDRLPSETRGIPGPSPNLQFQPLENGDDATAELRKLVRFEHWKPSTIAGTDRVRVRKRARR
jgi:hypothetical protein